jgi:hypothetical protein
MLGSFGLIWQLFAVQSGNITIRVEISSWFRPTFYTLDQLPISVSTYHQKFNRLANLLRCRWLGVQISEKFSLCSLETVKWEISTTSYLLKTFSSRGLEASIPCLSLNVPSTIPCQTAIPFPICRIRSASGFVSMAKPHGRPGTKPECCGRLHQALKQLRQGTIIFITSRH